MTDAKTSLLVTQYLPDIKPNTRYHLTYFIKTEDVERRDGAERFGACVNLYLSQKDGQNLFIPVTLHRGTLPWTKQGVIVKAGPNAGRGHRPYTRLYLYGTQGTVWFDDVRLRELHD